MSRQHGKNPDLLFSRGMRALRAGQAAKALPLLRESVDALGPENRALLSRRLYWLGIALFKLGRTELYLKAMSSALKLAPAGNARKMYCRHSNDYGMKKAACSEHDDYRAFFSIHVERYLRIIPGGSFSSIEEQETILEFIAQAWLGIKDDVQEFGNNCEAKLRFFRSVRLKFPVLLTGRADNIIPCDFGRRDIGPRCNCGSGLPYIRCCGRTGSHFPRIV